MNKSLKQLAEALGIATEFSDAGINRKDYLVSDKTVRFFANTLGYPADTEKQAQASYDKLQEKRWKKILAPVYVCAQNNLIIDVVSPNLSDIEVIAIDANKKKIPLSYEYLRDTENRGLFYKESLRITTPLNIGYYDIEVKADGRKCKSVLAVAPQKCHELPSDKSKLFGFAIQLYSLKSERNWGIGDFTDLKEFIKICSHVKADVIGINPINVLYHNCPENASPYMSISRTFLNPIYIDVEKVPEFNADDKKEISPIADKLRQCENIDYTGVYNLKIKYLEKCFTRFQAAKDKNRQQEYIKFCNYYGEDLQSLCLFQSIYEQERSSKQGFNVWSKIYTSPDCEASQKFASLYKDRIEFFKFLQFETDRKSVV